MSKKEKKPLTRKFFAEAGRRGATEQAAHMTPEERKERARKAAQARWRKSAQ